MFALYFSTGGEKRIRHAKLACSLLACLSLLACRRGDGGRPKDAANARLYDACKSGDGKSCTALAKNYDSGTGLRRTPRRTRVFLEKGCNARDGWACAELGDIYRLGRDVDRDEKKASAYLTRACEYGQAFGCYMLAVHYSKGIGVAPDLARAAALHERGCALRYFRSCISLGFYYATGYGVAKDPARAADYYMAACDGGELQGCGERGWLYEQGIGKKDLRKAEQLYRRACDGKHAVSCGHLALLYRKMKSEKSAAQYFELSCDYGEAGACIDIAEQYLLGRGVTRSQQRARAILEKSCSRDKGAACSIVAPYDEPFRPRLDRTMTAWKQMNAAVKKVGFATTPRELYDELDKFLTALERIDHTWVHGDLSRHISRWKSWARKFQQLLREGRIDRTDFEVLGAVFGSVTADDPDEGMERGAEAGRAADRMTSMQADEAERFIFEEVQALARIRSNLRIRFELRFGVPF